MTVQEDRATIERPRRLAAECDELREPDFIEFLSERLATNRAGAMDILADLVEAYRPAHPYEIRGLGVFDPALLAHDSP